MPYFPNALHSCVAIEQKPSRAQCVSLVGVAGSFWTVRGCIEDLSELFATRAQMKDHQDENKRPSIITTKLSDMQGSNSNEGSASPVSAQREGKTSGEAHPKKKRKVNHG